MDDVGIDEHDNDVSPGYLLLREAINLANQVPGHQTIKFDAGLSGSTISLLGGELAITDAMMIDASSLDAGLTIDAQQNSRVLRIEDGNGSAKADVDLIGLTIQGGLTNSDTENLVSNSGGGIWNAENLTIRASTVQQNQSTGSAFGAGIFNAEGGVLTLMNTTIADDSYGNLQFQQPGGNGQGSGQWLGQASAQVDATVGSVSSVGGPYDRNSFSEGAGRGTDGIPNTDGFTAVDSLSISLDYQFVLDADEDRGLADVGFRTDFGLASGYESAAQQGFRLDYVASSNSISFSPDLNDLTVPMLARRVIWNRLRRGE